MLEEKLRQAGESSARYRNRMMLMFLFGLLVCIAVIVMISLFDDEKSEPEPGEITAVHNSQPVDQTALREQFMQQLSAYEGALEQELLGTNLKGRDQAKDVELTSLKEKAISAFAMGDYATAVEKLTELAGQARETVAQRDLLFASAISGAKQALSVDDYMQAKLHISKATLLKQSNPEAQALEQRIERLPELISLMKKADIAAIENNPEKEYALLTEAVNIAPDREVLKQRRDVLAREIRENQFSSYISRGLVSVEKKDPGAARLHYKKAQALLPGRPELRVLNDAIIKSSDELDLNQAVGLAKKAIAEDDWSGAQSVYAAASKRHAKDKAILDGLQLANRLVSLQQALTDYINRPDRLSSRNVFAAAEDELVQANIFASYSKSLSALAAELKVLLASMNVKLPVFVKSDNQTYILVRGVGKVGLTTGREIELKPGFYTFEGTRPGYKSKLVQLQIYVGERPLSVEVVCDERI